MSESTASQPVENVARGAALALLAIPASIVASALLGSFLGIASGIVALAVAYFAGFLYSKGAGGAVDGKLVGPAGRLPYILIAAVAVLLGAFTSIVAATYAAFTSVNGRGGLLGAPFATTFRGVLANPDDIIFPIALCLIFGTAGIVSVVRGPKNKPAQDAAAQPVSPFQQPDQTGPSAAPVTPAVQTPVVQTPAAPTLAVPPVQAQPSPGVILNGKPIDLNKQ